MRISIIEFRFSGWHLEVRGTNVACGGFVWNFIFRFFGQCPGDVLCPLYEDVWEVEVQGHSFLSSLNSADEKPSFLVYDVYRLVCSVKYFGRVCRLPRQGVL